MVQDAVRVGLPHPITLIYSNRNPEGAAFHEEFVRPSEAHARFAYIPTMTQADTSRRSWTRERRRVSAGFLRDHLGDLATPICYLAGPPGLVAGVTRAVLEAGGDPSRLRSEEFLGY